MVTSGMARIFIVGSSNGLGLMSAQLLVEEDAGLSCVRAMPTALQTHVGRCRKPTLWWWAT